MHTPTNIHIIQHTAQQTSTRYDTYTPQQPSTEHNAHTPQQTPEQTSNLLGCERCNTYVVLGRHIQLSTPQSHHEALPFFCFRAGDGIIKYLGFFTHVGPKHLQCIPSVGVCMA